MNHLSRHSPCGGRRGSLGVFLVVAFCLLIAMRPVHAQWTQTNGPYGGRVLSLATSGTTVFVGTNNGGVFRSTNNGRSWTAAGSGLTNATVSALAVSPNGAGGTDVFAATPRSFYVSGGVFVSTNDGTSWIAVDSGLAYDAITTLAVSPHGAGGTNLFAGTRGSGVFLSTNNGTSWTAVNSGLTMRRVNALAVSATDLFAGTDGGGIYLSTDNGMNWTPVNAGLTAPYVRAFAVSGTSLFAATSRGVFVSTTNGTSWTPTGLTSSYVNALAVLPAAGTGGTHLFAGTGDGVFLSTNNGTSWTRVDSGLTSTMILALAVSPNGAGGTNQSSEQAVLFAGTDVGVFLSTNSGASWTAVNSGLTSTVVRALAGSGPLLFAGTDNNGVFLSTDTGTSWIPAGLTGTYVNALAVAPAAGGTERTNLFAGTSDGVFLSTDNGTSWTEVDSGLTYPYVTAIAVWGENLLAGAFDGVFLSTDNGTSWTRICLTRDYVMALAISPAAGGTGATNLFAGTGGHGVFFSTDNGKGWATSWFWPMWPHIPIQALAVSPAAGRTGVETFFAGTPQGLFLSTNNGTSWTAVNSGLTESSVTAFAVSGRMLFAGTSGDGVFVSANSGFSWTAVNSGMAKTNVAALAISGTTLFAGTYGGGVWKRSLAAEGEWTELPARYALEQNYPNPFNPSTTIRFSVSPRSFISLKVFDALGREVSTLVSEELPAGSHSRQWSAEGLASGVYFYRLQAGTFVQTRKLLLLR